MVIGLYEKVADCSILDVQTNTIRSAIIPIEDINSILPLTRNGDTTSQFNAIKDAILNGTLTLLPYTVQKVDSSNVPVTRASSSEKKRVMDELYDAGWPKAYSNVLRGSLTQKGVTAKLFHSVSYEITDFDFTLVIAETAISVIMTLLGLPASAVRTIISLSLSAAGVLQTIKDVTVKKLNTFCRGTKIVRVGEIQPYWAGRTVKWIAIVGDIGASLSLEYDNIHDDYNNDDTLLEVGLRNYFNM